MLAFSILVGLGLDYHVFLLSRVVEFRKQGFSDRESVLLGLARTGRVITAAGIIMAIAFLGLLFGHEPLLQQVRRRRGQVKRNEMVHVAVSLFATFSDIFTAPPRFYSHPDPGPPILTPTLALPHFSAVLLHCRGGSRGHFSCANLPRAQSYGCPRRLELVSLQNARGTLSAASIFRILLYICAANGHHDAFFQSVSNAVVPDRSRSSVLTSRLPA